MRPVYRQHLEDLSDLLHRLCPEDLLDLSDPLPPWFPEDQSGLLDR